jgi:serine/threonine protein kinase
MIWNKGQHLNNGNYIIERRLGSPGGFGVTYKAFHPHFQQYQVIKSPNIYQQDDPKYDKYVNWFQKEAQTLYKLCGQSNPHIVQVRNLFAEQTDEGNVWCLVMDFVDGDDLFKLIKNQKRLAENQAVSYIQQIGSGLRMIHEKFGLTHRDLHPGNIMLRDPQNVILIDFGLAREITPRNSSSMALNHAGNPGFAPYEQLMPGVDGSRDPKVDIYCLAATLYFLVTGEYPTPSVPRKLGQELILPRRHQPQLSKELEKAILWGMSLEAKDRPDSMRQWLDAFSGGSAPDELKSERGIDYTRLRDLLNAGEWKEADQETWQKMLEVMGRTERGYLDTGDINNFPCTDLRTIDQLWVKASKGRFGFSVQKKIWLECGGKFYYDTECELGDRVGWRENGKWKNYDALTFGTQAPEGHLPGLWCRWVVVSLGRVWSVAFFSRVKTCKL